MVWFSGTSPNNADRKAAFTPNLKDTVDMLFEQAYVCYENPKMQGCLYLLEKIKSNLEKNGTGAWAIIISYCYQGIII